MDSQLFEKLYETCYMRVYSYLLSLTGNQSVSEDLTQETFLKAFTSKSEYRSEAEETTWLCAIAKNLFIDKMRSQKHFGEIPGELDAGVNIEAEAADKDMSMRIHMALHTLNEPYREVFELRVFGDLSFAEIGTVFGKTESWARVTYHRAKLQIRERMVLK